MNAFQIKALKAATRAFSAGSKVKDVTDKAYMYLYHNATDVADSPRARGESAGAMARDIVKQARKSLKG